MSGGFGSFIFGVTPFGGTPPAPPVPPAFGDADYQAAMQRLLPRGPIWRSDAAAVLTRVLKALAPTYTRSTQAAAQVLIDASPATTVNLLVEWEESLGLPDPCTVSSPSIAQRQAAVRAKFASRGSLTIGYFIALAAALGFTVTITEFSVFVVGDVVGPPLYGPAWNFAWQIAAPQIATLYFTVGVSAAGDPLTTYDSGELVCRITANAPAETTPFFVFS